MIHKVIKNTVKKQLKKVLSKMKSADNTLHNLKRGIYINIILVFWNMRVQVQLANAIKIASLFKSYLHTNYDKNND